MKAKPAAIAQAPEADQRLLDIAARTDAGEGIRQGLADAKQGKLRPAREFFEEFEAAQAIFCDLRPHGRDNQRRTLRLRQ